MKVVIDTNVLLSAALKDRVPETVVVWIVTSPGWHWIATPDILDEYVSVLRRPKFDLSAEILERWTLLIAQCTTLITPLEGIEFPRDRKDEMFLSCALATAANYLISGDKDLTSVGNFAGTVILTASEFHHLFCN